MTTIMYVVIAVVAILAVIFMVKYFSGRNKSVSNQSSGEKISVTLVNKLKRSLRDVADGIRDINTVKDEIMQAFDEAKIQLKNDYADYIKNMITARETYKKVTESSASKINTLKTKAKQFKTKFEANNNVHDKEMADKYIAQLISMTKINENANTKYKQIVSDIDDAQSLFELEAMKLEDKRLEVITLCCAPDVSAAIATFKIDDLTDEFTRKMTEKNIETETNKIVNNSNSNYPVICQNEITNVYNSL